MLNKKINKPNDNLSSSIDLKYIYPFLLFIFVLLLNSFIRWEVILNEFLYLDDLIYLPKSLIGQCFIPKRHPIDFSFICYIKLFIIDIFLAKN